MKETWFHILDDFKDYIGNGWFVWACFLVALVFCLVKGNDRRKRLFTFSAVAIVILFNPLVYKVVGEKFMSGVYWRLFWVIPTVITLGITLTDLAAKVKMNLLRLIAVGVLCIVIAKTGTFFFNGDTYCVPENDYEIPQVAIDVSDEIQRITEGGYSTVIVPNELLCYIRQYTTNIALCYGRNIWGYMNNPSEQQMELYNLMNAEQIDYQALHDGAKGYGCDFIVFNSDVRQIPDKMESYGYTLKGSTGCYLIYSLE